MSRQHETTRRAAMWWWIGGAAALVVVGLLVAGLLYVRGQEVWTDGMDLAVTHEQAAVREVLWTPPEAMAEEFNTPGEEYEVCLSPDESEMYFVRGVPGKADLFVSRRRDGAWSSPEPVMSVNTEHDELGPRLSRDGQTLLFYSNRPGGLGGYDIWAAVRGLGGWRPAVNLGPAVNGPYNEYSPAMDADGGRLFFSTNRKAVEKDGGDAKFRATIREPDVGDYDLFMAELSVAVGYQPPIAGPTTQPATSQPDTPPLPFVAGQAVELQGVNSPRHEGAPCVSPAGDFLYFTSNRAGGAGGFDLYRVRITDVKWPAPEALGADVNTEANETDPQLVAGGLRMYFSSDRGGEAGSYDLYVTTSREVYTDRHGRPLPQFGWSVWVALVALALLIPLLLFLKAGGYKHLSTLQKCVVASLLLHVLLTLLLSVGEMSQQIIASLQDEGSMEATVDLSISNRIQIVSDIRKQVSNLPMVDAEQTMVEQTRTDLPALRAAPPTLQSETPPSQMAMTSRMEAPVIRPPRPPSPVDDLLEPEPPLDDFAPTLTMDDMTPQPLVKPEAPPDAAPDEADPVVSPRASQPILAAATVAPLATPPPPSLPQHSVVVARHPDRPLGREAPDDPAPEDIFQEMPLDISAPAIDVARMEPDRNDEKMPPVVGVPVRTTRRQPTSMPAFHAGELASAAPRPALATPSHVKPAASNRPPARITSDVIEPDVEPVDLPSLASAAPVLSQGPAKSEAPRGEIPLAAPGHVARRVSPNPAAARAPALASALTTTRTVGPSGVTSRVRARAPAPRGAVEIAVDDLAPSPEGPQLATGPVSSPVVVRAETPPPNSAVSGETTVKTARASGEAPAEQASSVTIAMVTRTAPHRRESLIGSNVAMRRAKALPRAGGENLTAPAPILPEHLPPSMLQSPDALPHRSVLRRPDLVKKMGGTPESEEAVERALRYLANTQQADGRWTTITDRNTGRKRRKGQADIALTGLAVLCNLAGGYTPAKESNYQMTVSRGLDYLISRQGKDGNLWESGGRMYGHAIATLALGEAAAMTGEAKYRQAAHKAAEYIIQGQHRTGGGWRYRSREKGDTSVFGWCVMALHSAKRVGLKIPRETRDGMKRYLANTNGGRTGVLASYQGHGQKPAMSAEAAFARMLLGEELKDAQKKELGDYLLKEGRQKEDYYCWYYASMAMFQVGESYWKQWNPKMREYLIKRQVTRGSDDGSWPARGQWAGHSGAGKIYTTTMATLTLEVYYRYLPMFGGKEGTLADGAPDEESDPRE